MFRLSGACVISVVRYSGRGGEGREGRSGLLVMKKFASFGVGRD